MFTLKPDYEKSRDRYEAFWEREIIDRPPVKIILPIENPKELPKKKYTNYEEQWLDIEYRAEMANLNIRNRIYLADALPIAWPNMGPEIFSAWCGCGYEFGENTTWSKPCVSDWEADTSSFSMEHPLFKKLVAYTELLLEYGKGNFIVGLTDFHAGGDHLAALRDPQELALDMIENADAVKAKLKVTQEEYFKAYNFFYELLRSADMPITTWLTLIHEGKYYVPSNDFSCMISKQMYDDIFLPGIIEECKFLDRSIYHLDGPGALRHLDSLLDIAELDAIQWVCGAGNEGFCKWVNVYKRIQSAGKGMELYVDISELPYVFESLRPEGICFGAIHGIHDRDTAQRVIDRITAWK